ncbi:uncharacterized protein METZ01_LOCUS169805, partial [marine metagenome]
MKQKPWLLISAVIAYIFSPTPSFSSNIQFSASVNKSHIAIEDSIELSIKISGIRNPPKPELPTLPDFTVRTIGTHSSTQIINSKMQVSTVYKYLLIPKNKGNYTIDSISILLSGTIYNSDPITIVVNKSDTKETKANREVYTETIISKKDPYINEQVVYTFKLFRKTEARNLNLSMPHDETFFQQEDLGKAKRYSTVIEGIAYDVDEVSIALFPKKAGKSTIPPSTMELDLMYRSQLNRQRDPFARFFNDPFFSGATKKNHKLLSTKPIELNIRPLPVEGKPKGFKNLVGQFDMTATIGKDHLDSGDTTTLTIIVSGIGNVMDTTFTNLKIGSQFKVYPDQPTFTKTIHGNQIGGEKVFKFALVPFSTGQQAIPSVTLNYFDPDKKSYKKVSTNPINIEIKPATSNEHLNLIQPKGSSTQQSISSVSVLARDILPIHTQTQDFEIFMSVQNNHIIFIIGIIAPIVIYLLAAGYIRYNHQMNDDISFSRRQIAHSNAMKKLNLLSKLNPETKDFVRELSQIIREYIGDKLNLQGTAFTSKEVEEKLNKNTFAHE